MNKRYLNVLRMNFLGGDIPLYCAFGYRTDAGYVVTPRPHTGKPRLEPRELFPERMRGKSLELSGNLGGGECWVAFDKDVDVVWHYLQGVYRRFKVLCLLVEKSLEPFLNCSCKDCLAVFGTQNKVVLERPALALYRGSGN